MSWFIFALISLMGWGCADLFYKQGTDEGDRYSHLKIAVWVGLVMGICALLLLPLAESITLKTILPNALKYLPASIGYIVSMVIGYAGLRYLELSIVSPVQNASGAFSGGFLLLWFALKGANTESLSYLDMFVSGVIIIGVILLAVAEQRLSLRNPGDKKYRFGALALLFPLLYCLFDTLGTTADGIILSEEAGLGLGEIDVIILYGLTFLLAGIVSWLVLLIKAKCAYNPFAVSERSKGIAALCEELGQIFYVYAMAARPVLAAPMVASYCIVSVLLSRLVLKERLTRMQYLCVALVIAGIVALGISEGLNA